MASSAAEKALETYSRSILFVEELTADESESHVINDLDPEKSVAALCKSIAQAINDTASGSTMKVIFAGEVMDDGTKRLSEYGVHNGDTIYFIRSVADAPPPYDARPPRPDATPAATPAAASSTPMLQTLFFRDLDGKSLTLRDVSIDTKMKDVFHRLGQEKAIDTEWLRFIWSGKQLSGGRTIRDYGIMNESTIHIVARLRGGQ